VPNVNGQPGFSHQPYNTNLSTYTSLNAGANLYSQGGANPSAQKIEIDIARTWMDGSLAGSFVRIWGIGLGEIKQASNLAGNGTGNGMKVYIFAGMSKGLPLANPAQAGLLASGQIFSAFGNWVGTNMSLDIYLTAGGSSPSSSAVTGQPGTTLVPTSNDAPSNIVFQWKAGQPLLTPLVNTLQGAYPTYSIFGAVHEGLVWAGATATHFCATLNQFAQYLRQKSLSMIAGYAPATAPGSYPGVSITLDNDTLSIQDGTTQTAPKQIQFVDLVGQPSWIQQFIVQATCVMRADIHVGDYVTLPAVAGITTVGSTSQYFNPTPGSGAYSSLKNGSVFSGTYQVVQMHHVGDSRGPDATAWVTTLDLQLSSTGGTVVPSLPKIWAAPVTNKYGFSS